MKRFPVLGLLSVLLVAVFASAAAAQDTAANTEALKKRLVGQWSADVEKTIAYMKENEEVDDEMLAGLEGILSGMGMRFTADDKITILSKMGEESGERQGTYSVTLVDGEDDQLNITVKTEDSPDEEKKGKLTFVDQNNFRLETEEGQVIFMKRKAEREDDRLKGGDDDDDQDDDGDGGR